MLPDESFLEHGLERELGVAAQVCVGREPANPAALSAGERARFERLGGEERRRAWLRGRMALKNLLRRLGEDGDTSALEFPHRRFSLSHSAGFAVAVGTCAPPSAPAPNGAARAAGETRSDAPGAIRGIGVDLELDRRVKSATARFFLTEAERRVVDELPAAERTRALLRLWTVKEALYKADPENAGSWFTAYAIEDPRRSSGHAARATAGNEGGEMRFMTFPLSGGYLSFAVCLGGLPDPPRPTHPRAGKGRKST